MKSLLPLHSPQTQQYPEVLHWVRYIFIPQIFFGSWYNGMAPTDSEDGYLPDRTSSLVGMARLRQLRILNGEASFAFSVAITLCLFICVLVCFSPFCLLLICVMACLSILRSVCSFVLSPSVTYCYQPR